MKKILSLVLVVVMLMSMTVTAFAASEQSGTTTLTVEVPEPVPEYTIHIPANMTLEYGNTDYQAIGKVYASDVKNVAEGSRVWYRVAWTNLVKGEDTIHLEVCYWPDWLGEWNGILTHVDRFAACDDTANHNPREVEFAAWVGENWGNPVPGTYTATVTWNFFVE